MSSSKISFPEIVQTYQQQLYWYIRRIVLIHEDAEDILQETLIKAYRRLWTLRSQDALRPWLYRIATNETNRYFRTRKQTLDLESIEYVAMSDVQPASVGDVGRVISSAVLSMTPLQRQVFCLKYYDDMDYDQIAAVTGSNKNTLMVCYHEAKKKIEKEIKE